jgi:hypothetical protein
VVTARSSKSTASPTFATRRPARPRGNEAGNRSAVEFGEQGLVVHKAMDLGGIGLWAQAAAFEELADTAVDAFCQSGHFGVAGWERGPESDF